MKDYHEERHFKFLDRRKIIEMYINYLKLLFLPLTFVVIFVILLAVSLLSLYGVLPCLFDLL